MADPRIPMKNRYLAAVLAYLVPGAGHLYQGRTFKGTLYLVCILGAYLFGLSLAQWKAVYWRWEPGQKNIAFFAQAGVGMFAIPALVQSRRYTNQPSLEEEIERPLSAEFRGKLQPGDGDEQEIVGRIELKTELGDLGPETAGRFTGRGIGPDGSAQPLELELAPLHASDIEPRVGAGAERKLIARVLDDEGHDHFAAGRIEGHIERPFADHFAAPLQDKDLEDLSGNLGKFFELAKIFTWIAGLLNVLAVWDALEGPAYGYGDEEESTDDSDGDGDGAVAGKSPPGQTEQAARPAEKTAAAEEPVARS